MNPSNFNSDKNLSDVSDAVDKLHTEFMKFKTFRDDKLKYFENMQNILNEQMEAGAKLIEESQRSCDELQYQLNKFNKARRSSEETNLFMKLINVICRVVAIIFYAIVNAISCCYEGCKYIALKPFQNNTSNVFGAKGG